MRDDSLTGRSNIFIRGCYMNQTNSIVVDGNLVRDSAFSEPKAGFKVCRLSVAVNRWYKNENGNAVDKVSYFDVETYGNCAEFCGKYGKKGAPMRVVGRLQQDRWTSKDGKNESRVYIVAERVELLRRPGVETEISDKSYIGNTPDTENGVQDVRHAEEETVF